MSEEKQGQNSKHKIKIIFEDEHLLVVNKPAGLMVHRDGRSDEYTLADWLLKMHPEIKEVGEPWTAQNGEVIYRPGIVHRLDRETSGVLVIAKDGATFEELKNAFKKRLVQKEYRAFVYGGFKEEKMQGVIERKIGRSPADFRKYSAESTARGTLREARTEYKVLEQSGSSQERDFAYLALFPKTGRTHQIRVHLKYIHHPIVCDKLYAPKKPCALGFERVALHAYKISFELQGKVHDFRADLPSDFESALVGLGVNPHN